MSFADTKYQYGENGHIEQSFSSKMRDKIVQLNFQLTRTSDVKILNRLENMLFAIMAELRDALLINPRHGATIDHFVTLYKMIGHTRDIIDGKGEYTLAYMMIYVWDCFWPVLAQFALYNFVCSTKICKDATITTATITTTTITTETITTTTNVMTHPYGSWKDIKYLCTYLKNKGHDATNSSLINYAITLANQQIRLDCDAYMLLSTAATNPVISSTPITISLASKWVPRETSNKFGWLFTELSRQYFQYERTASTPEQSHRSLLKCKTDYRKMIASMNIYLDTVQIKQCGYNWSAILPQKQTSITLHKQKNAFLNKNKRGDSNNNKNDINNDRIECASNFESYIEQAAKGEIDIKDIKGGRIGLNDFTKHALEYIENPTKFASQINLLNAQWKSNSRQTSALRKMIAMVDVSGSMNGDPLNCAIALGIRVAEKSLLGKRIMTFNSEPSWINLNARDDCDNAVNNSANFVDCVSQVKLSDSGTNANFYAAMDLILTAIVASKMSAEDASDMTLAVFSDMQIDANESVFKQQQQPQPQPIGSISIMNTMFVEIEKKYARAGMQICGKPYKPPHILFWNLRSTTGFPTLSNERNTTMMSGFSPASLNLFRKNGETTSRSFELHTPYSMLKTQLDNPRYDCLEEKSVEFLSLMTAFAIDKCNKAQIAN